MKPSGLKVSVAPHIHCGNSIQKCMYSQVLALLPAVAVGFYFFGLRALMVIAVAILTAMAAEFVMCRALKVKLTVFDGNAILIGLLLALLMPASTPWWAVVVGAVISIMLAKWLFGGNGSYPFNPVLIGWVMLNISWPKILSSWPEPRPIHLGPANTLPIQTLLEVLKGFGVEMTQQFSMLDMLLGAQGGGIGAVAGLALIAGGVYLIARGFISWHIPAGFILGLVVFSGIYFVMDATIVFLPFSFTPGDTFASPVLHLIAGSTLLGIFFLAPEYSSSPCTKWGKLLYGLGCGCITVLIRIYGIYPDGVAFAILLMNLCTPIFDRIRPRVIGLGKEVAVDA